MNCPDTILAGIAREHLHIPTLETRRSDSLDFHNVAVWQIEAALKAAFAAGTRSTSKSAAERRARLQFANAADLLTPLVLAKGTALQPGKMYLRLYDGRTDPDQKMDDWGFDGPIFGPLSCYVHSYCSTFRIHGEGNSNELWLERYDDMISWDGCFYGDLELFIAGNHDKA